MLGPVNISAKAVQQFCKVHGMTLMTMWPNSPLHSFRHVHRFDLRLVKVDHLDIVFVSTDLTSLINSTDCQTMEMIKSLWTHTIYYANAGKERQLDIRILLPNHILAINYKIHCNNISANYIKDVSDLCMAVLTLYFDSYGHSILLLVKCD